MFIIYFKSSFTIVSTFILKMFVKYINGKYKKNLIDPSMIVAIRCVPQLCDIKLFLFLRQSYPSQILFQS